MPELIMKLQKIYSALLTTDLAAAESWYTKLLGRGPDYRPMETLIQWDLFAQGGLQLATDDRAVVARFFGEGALPARTPRRRLPARPARRGRAPPWACATRSPAGAGA